MTKLTSRPEPVNAKATRREMVIACQPAMNILRWLSTKLSYKDDSQKTMNAVYEMLEEALVCMELFDFAIMAAPTTSSAELHYSVALKKLEEYEYVACRVIFQVHP